MKKLGTILIDMLVYQKGMACFKLRIKDWLDFPPPLSLRRLPWRPLNVAELPMNFFSMGSPKGVEPGLDM